MTELGGYFCISDKNGREKQESISKGTCFFFSPFSTRPAAQLFFGFKRLSAGNGVLGSMKA